MHIIDILVFIVYFAAIWCMVIGGTTTVVLIISNIELPFGLDANIFGIAASALIYFSVTFVSKISARC